MLVSSSEIALFLNSSIVTRIQVSEGKRTYPVDLDNGETLRPREMMHLLGHKHETARLHQLPRRRIEFVPHPDTKRAAYHGHILVGGMIVRPHAICVGHFEPQGVWHSVLGRIALDHSRFAPAGTTIGAGPQLTSAGETKAI